MNLGGARNGNSSILLISCCSALSRKDSLAAGQGLEPFHQAHACPTPCVGFWRGQSRNPQPKMSLVNTSPGSIPEHLLQPQLLLLPYLKQLLGGCNYFPNLKQNPNPLPRQKHSCPAIPKTKFCFVVHISLKKC